ncbi:hypothetical protein L1987_17031 [Smallanthus sonchifolius]|uniref:Uncharacterized protein n=1 Tax=Smallanthus sonchifolius TaxID=185202 RepID=A0ACB9IWD2_9ASTR|nr:hypothetical protein L1987_17031 [Smallanthus sonchifolius]
MGKLSVIIYITVALLLLLISHSPNKSAQRNNPRRHRRLQLRSNFSCNSTAADHHIPFDPLVADIERKREDILWEKSHFFDDHHHEAESESQAAPGMESQSEWEDFIGAEDYLNEEHKFNITHRLVLLFPRIDVDPVDGFVSEHELTEWNLEQSQREVLHRSQREMELHDKNHDGLVSLAEYQPPTWVRDSVYVKDMGWWKDEHFNASDSDGDGFLNITDFNNFQHPADTKNPRLLQWLCKEEVRERDTDKDGHLNFKEFFHGLFDMVKKL